MKRLGAVVLAAGLLMGATGCAGSPEDGKSNAWQTSYFDCMRMSEINGDLEDHGQDEMENRCSLFADTNEGKTVMEVIESQ